MKKLSIVIVIFFAIALYFYNTNITRITNSIYLDKSLEIKSKLSTLVQNKQGDSAALAYLIAQDLHLKDSILKKDNSRIDFTKTIKGLHKETKFKNIWIHIVDKDGKSFYRSWAKKSGDDLTTFRFDIVRVLKTQKPLNIISTGKFDMTFKSIRPIFYNGEFIGIVELITHFNSIAKLLKEDGIEPVIIVDKSFRKKLLKPFSGLFIGDYYIANKNASTTLMNEISSFGIDKFISIEGPMVFKDYLVVKYDIRDIRANDMAYSILFSKLSELDLNKIQEYKVTMLIWFIIIFILIMLVVFILMNQSHLETLNKNVYEKTKHIEEQKEELTAIVDSYDQNVISSQTDANGIITKVSSAFSQMSGYSKEELIGKRHNIFKHPDMPDELFTDLWNTISSGKIYKGEVKNLKKDGGYYWSLIKITPRFDQFDDIIGFSSIRHDITSQKDFESQHLKLVESEKMASIGEMIGNIAHQWRQPLSVIATEATSLMFKEESGMLKDGTLKESCTNINDNAQYLSKTIDDFRNFIKGDQEAQVFNLANCNDSFLKLIDSTIKNNNLKIITDIDKELSLKGYPNELIQCFMNILNNAKDALIEKNNEENRYVFISHKKVNDYVEIVFKDNAGGIPDDILPKIFEPYFTTKHNNKGTGLGLHMSYNLITKSMHGTISATNTTFSYDDNTFAGAKFTIKLPILK